MRKNISFVLISIAITILIFTTAASCNMCGLQLSDQTNQEQKGETEGQQSKETTASKDTTKKSQESSKESQDSSNTKSSDDASSKNIEIADIVIGNMVDGNVEPASFFLTDSTYYCHPLMVIPPNGTETYNWSVTGGSCESSVFLIKWNTPSDEGTYKVSLDITKDDGSFGKFSKDVLVEILNIIDEPPQTPTIVDIEVSGDTDKGNYLFNTVYRFNVSTTEPFDMIDSFIIIVSDGTVLSQSGGIMEWKSPDNPGEVTITAKILDKDGNIMDTKSKILTFKVQ